MMNDQSTVLEEGALTELHNTRLVRPFSLIGSFDINLISVQWIN